MRQRPVIAILERHYSRVRGELQAMAEEIVAAGVAGPELKARRAPEIDARNALISGHRDLPPSSGAHLGA